MYKKNVINIALTHDIINEPGWLLKSWLEALLDTKLRLYSDRYFVCPWFNSLDQSSETSLEQSS